jgi:hypothetical protein
MSPPNSAQLTLLPYLPEARRAEFVAALGGLGRLLWWVSHEAYTAGLALVQPGRDDLRPGRDDLRPGRDDLRPGRDDLRPGRDDLRLGGGEPAFGVLGTAHWDGTGGAPAVRALAKTGLHGQRLVWLPLCAPTSWERPVPDRAKSISAGGAVPVVKVSIEALGEQFALPKWSISQWGTTVHPMRRPPL